MKVIIPTAVKAYLNLRVTRNLSYEWKTFRSGLEAL